MESRNDFDGGYMYLKYINRFASIASKNIDLRYKKFPYEDLGPLEEGIAEMLEQWPMGNQKERLKEYSANLKGGKQMWKKN